ncbi:MAG TPA: phosphoglucosamine mutase [Spirochaetota bacterium]|nr:phosphoglucosamine mutase [Spirochaetota bacterium]OPZ38173.1 MAG: Phosphomannomutase/phosphoglucomutase [Spirochaetes bacterium ADurb.BinA120]HPI15165.1 phosphoglucosamine mutase [Spirochaetota bacterium]HPO45281.1 phosphoglucosamine mutase [Spirochaetota bacterium]HPV96325.1 phosphoglucosamine mutase [Spirochaetota bacterium]
MAGTLMKSVSGIRGVVGDGLTPELVLKVASAFACQCRGKPVVVGRDSRPTGAAISEMACSALAMHGCDVLDVGIVPTPTVQIMVEETAAGGGMVISASHNPIEWNAFKLIGKKGTFLDQREIEKFFDLMEKEHPPKRWNAFGAISRRADAADIHIERVLAVVDAGGISRNRFRVALDSVNGAGSIITRRLLERLGCEIVPVHCEITGSFPRGAEPLAENLTDLCEAVRSSGADIGFAQDPDADRLAIVDEKGIPIGEEYTLTLIAEHLLSKRPGRVVVNLSTTRAIEEVAKRHESPFTRTRVGEINVVERMRKLGARIGGEGNGGVIAPEVHLGRDSLAGIVYVLEMMAERRRPVSELAGALPRYVMKKGKVPLPPGADTSAALAAVSSEFRGERISDIDGLRIDFVRQGPFAGGWVHLRSSNTEPIFRVIAEGRDGTQAEDIYRYFARMFK